MEAISITQMYRVSLHFKHDATQNSKNFNHAINNLLV